MEKINYEFFDFTNKALDIMINDNFMNKSFDLDITYIDSYENVITDQQLDYIIKNIN